MLSAYRDHVADRAAQGIPPLPLNAQQASALCELLQNPPTGEINKAILRRIAKMEEWFAKFYPHGSRPDAELA